MEPGKAKLTVLLIEDDQKFAAGLGSVIGDSRDFELRHAELVSAGLTELSKGRIDVVLLDLFLHDSRGLETFMRVHAGFPDVPLIVLSGSSDESVAIETVRRGAQDYVDKADLDV